MTEPAATAAWPWHGARWVGHRGAGKSAPENTLAAFRHGHALGWRAFECDVKLSADGHPFLLHDATLERTTNGHGPAAALDWAALARLDAGSWHSPAFAGEPPASLRAVAAFCLANDAALNIELKPSPGADLATGRIVAMQAAALWVDPARPPLLSSFSPQALEGARTGAARLPRALLLADLWPGWLDCALGLGCTAVVFHHPLAAGAAAEAAAAGLRWLAYTVNDPVTAQQLLALGADAVISDELTGADEASAAGAPTFPPERR